MSAELFNLLEEIGEEKGIGKEVILDALESALISAYKKNYGAVHDIDVKFDKDGGIKIYARKNVVEEVENKETEISLEDAQAINSEYQIGDIVEREVTPSSFGRIAAQTARQVVLQRLREAEREKMVDEYTDLENSISSAVVRKIDRRNVILEIDGAESVLMPNEQVKQDNYKVGERYKVFVVEVADTVNGVHLIVSRSHPGLVKSLFELEVPEIAQGVIDFKGISREAGSRSKIAVASNMPNVDPVGTCIGAKGMRVQNVINELRGEKIDIIQYSDDPEEFISNAVSPADVVSIEANLEEHICKVVVPESQLSLAIGREGQNVRLAARLTGWKIDLTSIPDNEIDKLKKSNQGRKQKAADTDTADNDLFSISEEMSIEDMQRDVDRIMSGDINEEDKI